MREKSPLNYALMLLKIRDRSQGEIKEKMLQKGFGNEEVLKTIETLREHHFLDDEQFAKGYVRSQLTAKPRGKYQLAAKLKKLKVNNETIKSTFEEMELDEFALAKEAAQNWVHRHQQVPREKIYEKLGRYLVGQGFGWEVVRSVLDEIIST